VNEWSYSITYCLPWHLDVGEWSNLCPEHFTAGEMATRNVFETDLDSLEKSLWNLPGIKPYFLSYPACALLTAQTTLVWKQVIHHQILEPLHAEISSVIILHPDDKCTLNHRRASAWSHLRKLYNKKHGPNSKIKRYKLEWIVLFEKHVTQAIPSKCNRLTLKSSVTIKLFQNGNDSIAYVEEIYLLCLNKLASVIKNWNYSIYEFNQGQDGG